MEPVEHDASSRPGNASFVLSRPWMQVYSTKTWWTSAEDYTPRITPHPP